VILSASQAPENFFQSIFNRRHFMPEQTQPYIHPTLAVQIITTNISTSTPRALQHHPAHCNFNRSHYMKVLGIDKR